MFPILARLHHKHSILIHLILDRAAFASLFSFEEMFYAFNILMGFGILFALGPTAATARAFRCSTRF